VPPGWHDWYGYWSATPAASGHASFDLYYGLVYTFNDNVNLYVAVEVL
jgi:hypothetical protein